MANILLVDDSSSIRQLAAFTLKSQGHSIEEADSAETGITKAKAGEFDLIITDQNMPGKNGIDLAKDLRSDNKYKFVPILMLTTESDQSMKMEGKAAGVTGWIVKPFKPEALASVVAKVTN